MAKTNKQKKPESFLISFKARSVQMRVVVISERVLGFDHPNTIEQYVSYKRPLN